MVVINYPDYKVHNPTTIYGLLMYTAKTHDTLSAFERIDSKLTYGELKDKVLRVSNALISYKDVNILIAVDDPIYFSIAYFSVIISGNIAVLYDSNKINRLKEEIPIAMILSKENIESFLRFEPIQSSKLPTTEVDKLCTILFSSGTTSSPKGIMLSQKNICSNIVSGLEKYKMCLGDRVENLIPYYHAFGLVVDLLAPLLVGATICVPDDKSLFFLQMPIFKPTILNVPPIIAETLAKLIMAKKDVESITGGKLKKILCGGATLNSNISRILRKYNISALGCYGLSECSPCVSVNRDDYYKDGSAGVILNCNQVIIGEDNEILIKGSNVMLGYYNDNEFTKKVIINEFLHTGDLGYIDADGFLYLNGRKNNMIVLNDGTKCIPEFYEQEIIDNTAAEEVLVYSDEKRNATKLYVLIYVSDEKQVDSITRYVQNMDIHHSFDRIDFKFLPLEKTTTGKIRRI